MEKKFKNSFGVTGNKLVGNGVSIPPVKMIAEKLKKIYDI